MVVITYQDIYFKIDASTARSKMYFEIVLCLRRLQARPAAGLAGSAHEGGGGGDASGHDMSRAGKYRRFRRNVHPHFPAR